MMHFEDQVAIITGAGRGLGRRYAIALAQRGANVVLIDYDEPSQPHDEQTSDHSLVQDNLSTCMNLIERIGAKAMTFELDVSDVQGVNDAIAQVVEQWGRVDILINNAGVYQTCEFEHLSYEHWHRQIDVDLHGSFNLTKAVWPIMRQQGYGRIIMCCGASALYGDMFESAFSATKMGLLGLVNSLHFEGDEHNIHVNSISPHADTLMTEKHLAASVKPLFSSSSVTSSVLFLASKDAPNGKHLLTAAGSVSHGQFAEFKPIHYRFGDCTPESISSDWPNLLNALPIELHPHGEDQILAWAKRGASEHQIKID